MKIDKRKIWVDHVGKRFGMLVILGDAEPLNNGKRLQRKVRCLCDCGKETIIHLAQLKPDRVSSCGCNRNKFPKTHGLSMTPTYRSWWGMVCRGKGTSATKHYADKGITVCERWQTFENFLEDMGERPYPKATIERLDIMKGYSPNNCEWASYHIQARNRSNTFNVTYQGETMCVTDLARKIGMDERTFYYRVKKHGVEKAVSMPIQRRPVLLDGVSTPLKRAADNAGIDYTTLSQRLSRGWELLDALQIPPRSRPKRLVVLRGEEMSVSEAARRIGRGTTTVSYHLDKGETMDEIQDYFSSLQQCPSL